MKVEKAHPEETNTSRRAQEESSSAFVCSVVPFIDIRAHSGSKIAHPERTLQVHELATSKRTANQKEDDLNDIITSLRADLHTQQTNSGAFFDTTPRASLTSFLLSNEKIANLEKTVQELRNQLATLQCASNQEKDSLNETINSLRADLHAEHQSSSASIATLTHASLTSKSVRQ